MKFSFTVCNFDACHSKYDISKLGNFHLPDQDIKVIDSRNQCFSYTRFNPTGPDQDFFRTYLKSKLIVPYYSTDINNIKLFILYSTQLPRYSI